MHFDLVSLSRYTYEPHYPADRNLCSKMELSLFTGFIFVSTALERPLLYRWTNDSGSLLQHYHPSTSLNECTHPGEQCERWTRSLSTPTQFCKHCWVSDSMVPTPFSLLPDTQVPFRLTPVFCPHHHAVMKNLHNTETLITMQRPARDASYFKPMACNRYEIGRGQWKLC